jgi:tRNA dimethylallyltransferase
MLSQNSRLDSNSNLALRQLLQKEAEELGYVAFHAKLAATDPASAALIHPNNVRRVVRAFELLAQGTSYAKASADFSSFRQYYRATYIGIDVKPELLYIVLNNRVDKMLAAGLLSEVQLLLDRGLRDALTAVQAIGYKELVAYLDGEVDLATAVSQIKQATRRYAKRQRSWFKRDSRISWIQADGYYTGYLAGEISGADLTNRLLTDALRLLELQL